MTRVRPFLFALMSLLPLAVHQLYDHMTDQEEDRHLDKKDTQQ